MTEDLKQRHEMILKAFDNILSMDDVRDLITDPRAFTDKLEIRITDKSDRAWAKMSRGGPVIQMSSADRDCDPIKYRDEFLVPRGAGGRTSWDRAHRLAAQGFCVYIEYPAIQYDKEIGMFVSDGSNAMIHVLATACHELAHAIHMWNHRQKRAPRGPLGSAHGVEWQAIYRKLRRLVVNDHVETATLYETKVAARAPRRISRPGEMTTTGRVWEICDQMAKQGRTEIITACILEGIAPGTAATQYAKWNRARNQD